MIGDLQEFVDACWKDVLSMVNETAVYIDHAAAECLHWYTGDKAYITLKDAGAISVHELSVDNLRNVQAKGAKKAVIISTSKNACIYQNTLKLIIDKNNFEKCIIICTVNQTILNYTSVSPNCEENENSYDALKRDILYWMNDRTISKNANVTIMFKPIFVACLKKNVFVTPPFGNLTASDFEVLSTDSIFSDTIKHLITSFHHLFSYYNVKQDIYSLGKMSNYAANELNRFSTMMNKSNSRMKTRKISVIFVDRLLDLSTMCSYNSESILGRILCTLPHLPHHSNDIAVLMDNLSLKSEKCSLSLIVPGCLASNNEELMDILFNKKQEIVLLMLNKMLIDMSTSNESPKSHKILTRISVHSLEKNIKKFRDTESLESLSNNSKKLQLMSAVVQALKSNKTAKIEFIISLEKLILQNLAVSGDSSSVLSQFSNIIKTRITRGLDMENLLVLLIYLYALAGPDIKFSDIHENELKTALNTAIYEDIKNSSNVESTNELSAYYQTLLLLRATDDEATREASVKMTEQIMEMLHKTSLQRQSLKKYRQVINKSNPHNMAQHVGILERFVRDLLDRTSYMPDLGFIDTVPSLYKYLVGDNEVHHPCDSPWVIIYVLGGITPDEIRTIENIQKTKEVTSPIITIGGTRLLNPQEVVDKILLSYIKNI
ncbi:PREDICTED: sec1 family domain-containing protein 2-like [Ceratosolen solmsi marchali]|uniref:Sec1 family domain-containing protein 2-like n=1 Tax=Ceratosolen solmsi marchali TaxID=326594 RepID=A0AAJ6YH95_9HYME|nr:PREDICTED: sec1 family domain-containing protein 2-like [Ceratosolen solmsi marchali]